MNNTKTYSLPPTDLESTPTQEYIWFDCCEANPSFNPGLTPADVYSWWDYEDYDEPYRKKKHKKKKRKKQKKQAARDLQYRLIEQSIYATRKKREQKEQRKQAKRELQYRLIERSVGATVDTVNAITKMYVARQLNPYRR